VLIAAPSGWRGESRVNARDDRQRAARTAKGELLQRMETSCVVRRRNAFDE